MSYPFPHSHQAVPIIRLTLEEQTKLGPGSQIIMPDGQAHKLGNVTYDTDVVTGKILKIKAYSRTTEASDWLDLLAPPVVRNATTIKVLDLSTRHLPQATLEDLNGYDGVIADPYLHGVWLWVPDDPAAHAKDYPDPAESSDGVPTEVLTIQLYARAIDCDWVRLDADGDRNADLPAWEW